MSIDWLTVSAQIVNFLVLLWLLKRFLYRPILDGIDAREAEIAQRMSEAQRLIEQAKAEEDRYRAQLSRLQAAEADMAQALRHKIDKERDELIATARRQLEKERKEFDAYLAQEKQKYIKQLHQAGASVLVFLARKALADLADETLEQRIAQHTLHRLEPMREELRRLARGKKPAVVTTHAPLPDPVRDHIRDGLQELIGGIDVQFDVDPAQSFGLVVRIGSAKVAWTIDSYIEELEALMAERLARPESTGVVAQ